MKSLKIIYLCLFFVLNIGAFAQHYSSPILNGNNGTNDIGFSDCASIVNLQFYSGFDYVVEAGGLFTWTLYKEL